jgi:hypothetical protein
VDGGARYGRFREQCVEISQLFLQLAQLLRIDGGGDAVDGERELRFFLAELAFDDLASTRNGVALVIKKSLDVERRFHVAATIESLTGAPFVGFKLRELTLPESQDVCRNVAELRDFADAEVEFIRDVGPGGWVGSADWLMLCHASLRAPIGAGWPAVGPDVSIGHEVRETMDFLHAEP